MNIQKYLKRNVNSGRVIAKCLGRNSIDEEVVYAKRCACGKAQYNEKQYSQPDLERTLHPKTVKYTDTILSKACGRKYYDAESKIPKERCDE